MNLSAPHAMAGIAAAPVTVYADITSDNTSGTGAAASIHTTLPHRPCTNGNASSKSKSGQRMPYQVAQ